MLHIYGFGKIRLAYKGRLIDRFPTAKVEELLVYLILKPKIRHSREKLITLLWPDVNLPSARHRFSIALSRLRNLVRTLDLNFEDYFETNNQWVGFLPVRPYQFDCHIFTDLFRQALQTNELSEKERLFREALALCHSSFMEGLYVDWVLTEREHLNRLHLRTLGQIMHCCIQRQAYDEAIEFGLDILQDDPLREDVHCALMTCYKAKNRPDLIIKQYQTCQALLKTELMLPPSLGTIALFQRLMTDIARNRLAGNPSSQMQKEIALALDTFNQAAHHLQQMLYLGGDMSTGPTV